jgi:phosphonopyruvate decarboxylase
VIEPAEFVRACRAGGVSLYTGVPDSVLKPFNTYLLEARSADRHVIAANEGAAVGIAIGHHLRTGRLALVYLQNSGFGNLVNPLLSLADPEVYGVPMLVLTGWRGRPGVPDEPQHRKQGRVMAQLLDAMELPWAVLPTEPAAAARCVAGAAAVANERRTPYVLLVEKHTFAETALAVSDVDAALPTREDALAALVAAIGTDALVVATTGMLSRELLEHRQRTGLPAGHDFLAVGGMGHASSVALGVAMAEPDREVWCLDGDGALLMHLGALAVIAKQAPARYFHVVFNNNVHDSVGGQPTAIDVVDVPALAHALGYRYADTGHSGAAEAVARLRAAGGPALCELRVRPGARSDLTRPDSPLASRKRVFMQRWR